jgi:hypothetical protein
MAEDNKCTTSVCGTIKTADCYQPFQLSNNNDSCVISEYVNESLLIAGADINVFKLLGIHQQGKLTDLTGRGAAIASSSQPSYDVTSVYDLGCGEWRSIERGNDVVARSYIGYNFGEIKLDNGRNQYGVNTYVQFHITTIRIQQGEHPNNRVTKARIEYSSDGVLWKGAAIVDLPNNDVGNLIHFKQSTPSKFWRIRPLVFSGGPNDYWVVQNLELIDLSAVAIDNIQDEWGFLENRDREYARNSVLLKGSYDMTDISSFLARFGMETTDEFTFRFHFMSMVTSLGRPLVIGDIVEIPSQIQYGPDMKPVRKYMEVTQTAWDTNGFTPGWTPTILRVVAAPLIAKQETMDIVGDLAGDIDPMGFKQQNPKIFSGLADILNEKIDSAARAQVPERGEDDTHKPVIPDNVVISAEELGADVMQLVKYETNPGYVRDAMPPGKALYTEGDTFPEMPKDGAYHRLTYTNVGQDIPPRLYRYSLKKHRWMYLETDERMNNTVNSMKISRFLNSPNRTNINEVN